VPEDRLVMSTNKLNVEQIVVKIHHRSYDANHVTVFNIGRT